MTVRPLASRVNRAFVLPKIGERFEGRWAVHTELANRGPFRRFQARDEALKAEVELEILPNPTARERSAAARFLTQCRENSDLHTVSILTVIVYGRDDRTGSVWAVRHTPAPSMSDAFDVHSLLNEGSTTLLLAGVHNVSRRDVAIKILRRAFIEQKTAVQRFRREARLAVDLKSPNIPACLAQGVSDDGRLYFAIERFPGQSLVERLEHGPISLKLADRIVQGIGAALLVAHAQGVVHRDVTPANVLLAGAGETVDDIKLLDFGIASVPKAREPKLSQIGRFVGTPAHCAPEQFYGFDINAKADVYGLASTLYQALTGSVPYTAAVGELIKAKASGPPPAPSSVRPGITAAVDRWLLAALQVDPAERPTLERWLESIPRSHLR